MQSAFVFVANEEGRSIAAIDVETLSLAGHAQVDGMPTAIVSHPAKPAILVLTPRTGAIHEISLPELKTVRKHRVSDSAHQMRLAPDGKSLWVLSQEARSLLQIDLGTLRGRQRIRFAATPEDFDVLSDNRAVVSFPDAGRIGMWNLADGQRLNGTETGGTPWTTRFRFDGRHVLTALRGDRMLLITDAAGGQVIARLPLALEPENFCFKSDGGVLFVTGEGLDAVASIYPYRNMVAETLLAGKSPAAMAVSSDASPLLFITNPVSGDVTAMDIITGKVIGAVSVGVNPTHIVVTPDSRYAMVLNRGSGDVAVILLDSLREKRGRNAAPPLLTLIRVGKGPVSAAVRLQA